jgi:HTH-type transcriptional regulator/antitoxin HigA
MVKEYKMVYDPDYATPPGETLRDLLRANHMAQVELAQRLGKSKKTINEIIQAKAIITPEVALGLAAVFGTSDNFWNNLESNYQLYKTKQKDITQRNQEKNIALSFTNYKELISLGFIDAKTCNNIEQKILTLRSFCGVSSLLNISSVYSVQFRQKIASKYKANSYSTIAWLRCGEIKFKDLNPPSYNSKQLKASLPGIKHIINDDTSSFSEKIDNIIQLLNHVGVVLFVVPYFNNTYVNGAAKFIGDTAVIQLSTKGKYTDILWFTLFHEIYHILQHNKKKVFIDYEDANVVGLLEDKRAEKFAQQYLAPKGIFTIKEPIDYWKLQSIKNYSEQTNTSIHILAGLLSHQFNNWKRWSTLREKIDPEIISHGKFAIQS